MYKLLVIVGGAVVALVSNSAVVAAPLLVTVTGADNLSFTLPSPSNPSGQYTGDLGSPALVFENVLVQGTPMDVTFYPASNAGSFSVGSLPGDDQGAVLHNFILGYGKQLFQGTISAPIFAVGSYSLLGGFPSTLVISAPATAVPEPATWTMTLAGLGAVGFAMRRRANVSVSFA